MSGNTYTFGSTVTIDRANWLRVREDGSVPQLGLKTVPPGADPLALSVSANRPLACAMGYVGNQLYKLTHEKMINVSKLSKLGVADFVRPVVSITGEVVSLEKELIRLNDRHPMYARLPESAIEARIAGLLSAIGINVQFVGD